MQTSISGTILNLMLREPESENDTDLFASQGGPEKEMREKRKKKKDKKKRNASGSPVRIAPTLGKHMRRGLSCISILHWSDRHW